MSTRVSNLLFGEEGGKRPSVRRCLFGKTDRENLSRALSLQEEILQAQDTKRFCERWGLNPITGEPVDGSPYVCTPVDVLKDPIPEFYTKGYAPRKSKPVSTPRESWRGSYNQAVFDSQHVSSRRNVKRRLQLDLDDDQENTHISTKVFICERKSQLSQSLEQPQSIFPSSSSAFTALTIPRSSSSQATQSTKRDAHRLCSSVNSTMDRFISPSIRNSSGVSPSPSLDLALCRSTPRSSIDAQRTPQHQTLMKDFFPLQKMRRCSSAKSLHDV